MKTIEIHQQPIALYQLLKFEALVSSGGEAKAVIDQGLVLLNSQIETQRRKKVMSGDLVEYDNQQFEVTLK
jgi:ribosome-associated protein